MLQPSSFVPMPNVGASGSKHCKSHDKYNISLKTTTTVVLVFLARSHALWDWFDGAGVSGRPLVQSLLPTGDYFQGFSLEEQSYLKTLALAYRRRADIQPTD